jgi:hypothetical protein
VRCCDETDCSFVVKVHDEVFAHFKQLQYNVTVVCGIDCLACQDKFFLMSKKMTSMLLALLFTGLSEFGLSSPNAGLIIAKLSVTLFAGFAQNLMVLLCWIHCKIES